jgi:hypothetical protein
VCRTLSTGAVWRCEPAGESTGSGRLSFYTRVRTQRDSAVVHRWYHDGALRQSVRLTIRANPSEGYRTFSRQTVAPGEWRVEALTPEGALLHEQRFTVR